MKMTQEFFETKGIKEYNAYKLGQTIGSVYTGLTIAGIVLGIRFGKELSKKIKKPVINVMKQRKENEDEE